MAEATAPNPADLITEALDRELNKPYTEDVKETYFALRQGYGGMMLDKITKQVEATFDLAKQTRDGTIGQPMKAGESEEMGVSIGHKTFNVTTAAPPQAPASTGLSTLAKVGVGAALTAAGVGLPAVGAALYALLDKDPPAAVAPATDQDKYLPYDFSIQ